MRKFLSLLKYFSMALIFMGAGTLQAQSILSLNFESNTIGDQISTVSWAPADIQSVVADDPLNSGNKVLKNVVHNYGAAPVLMFVLPAGKTLADYDSLKFDGYFQKGDIGYKAVVAEAYQKAPIGDHFLDANADSLGAYNRNNSAASTAWEHISINITNTTALADTIYITLGINCAGTANGDTTTWFADNITLVPKPAASGPIFGTSQDFESYMLGDSIMTVAWVKANIQSAVAEDPLNSGNKVLKNVVHNYGAAPVLMFVLPAGKTLADYDSLKFDGYFQKGDIGYKAVVAEAYQKAPIGDHFLDANADSLGAYNRNNSAASTAWEHISINITNTTALADTIYIALGINCAGTANGDTTTWFADNIQLVAKSVTPPPPLRLLRLTQVLL